MLQSLIIVGAVSLAASCAAGFLRARTTPSEHPAAAGIRSGILVGFLASLAASAVTGDFTVLTDTLSSVGVIAGACIGPWLENRIA